MARSSQQLSARGRPKPASADRPPPDWLGDQRHQPWSELDHFDRASVAVDAVMLTVKERRLHAVLYRREQEPHKGRWAVPGGMVHWKEELEQTLRRVIKQKLGVGLDRVDPYLVKPVNDFERDPRGWILSVAYLMPCVQEDLRLPPSTALALVPLEHGPDVVQMPEEWGPLAFEHESVIVDALGMLRRTVSSSDIGLQFVPERFTLRQLQHVHEAILGRALNRANFRRLAIETHGWVQPTGEFIQGQGQRRTELFERATP